MAQVNDKDVGPSRMTYPEWAGSPGYAAACRSLRSVPDDPAELSPDALYLAVNMADLLVDARPVVCPSSQISAIDDVFPSFAAAADYAADTELPFESMLFDFTPGPGESYPVVEVGGRQVVGQTGEGAVSRWEIAGLLAGIAPDTPSRIFMPLFVDPETGGVIPIGCALFNPLESDPSNTPRQHVSDEEDSPDLFPVSFNGAVIQRALKENAAPARGAYFGIGTMDGTDQEVAATGTQAVIAAVAFRMALKVLFLLDSVNIELSEVDLPRQSRRRAARKGQAVASKIQIRRSKSRPVPSEDPEPAGFEHQFEVRGNFAHYGPDTQLFKRSDAEHIRACPRCGRCRRVWRPPYIKGPVDKPLVLKVREVSEPEVSDLARAD